MLFGGGLLHEEASDAGAPPVGDSSNWTSAVAATVEFARVSTPTPGIIPSMAEGESSGSSWVSNSPGNADRGGRVISCL